MLHLSWGLFYILGSGLLDGMVLERSLRRDRQIVQFASIVQEADAKSDTASEMV